jgi:hypothetical protein
MPSLPRHSPFRLRPCSRTRLDPADALQPGDPAFLVPATPPFWGSEAVRVHMQVKCTFVNNSLKTMSAGSSFICPLLQSLRRDNGTSFGLQAAKFRVHLTRS